MSPDSLPPAITRRELHALVWSTPLSTLAKRFGTTGSHLAKVCDGHQVPRPGAGHWSKKAFGKEPALVVLAAGRAEDELVDLAEPAPSPRWATPRQPPAPVQKTPQAPKPEEPAPTISFPMTRAQLHHLVWSTPILKLAPRFQCSGVWLAKLCKKNQVPTPPRGYWAKRQVGKSPRRLALPRGVDPQQVVLERKPEPVPPPPPEPPAPPPPPHDPDVASLLKTLEGFAPIEMPADLSKAHPVVAQARRAFKERSRTDRWGHYVLPARPTRNPLTLDITEPHRERAFKILDSILRTLERLGFKTTAEDGDHLRTDAITEMLGGRFHFHVRERYKLVRTERNGRTARVKEHTGLLALDLLSMDGTSHLRAAPGRTAHTKVPSTPSSGMWSVTRSSLLNRRGGMRKRSDKRRSLNRGRAWPNGAKRRRAGPKTAV